MHLNPDFIHHWCHCPCGGRYACSFDIFFWGIVSTIFIFNTGKVHGSLARAGKVKHQTPKVEAQEKKKKKTGRAKRRVQYNRRFVNVVQTFGRKKGPNANA